MSSHIKIDRVKAVLEGLQALTKSEVLVGIPESTAAREDEPEANNASIGYIQETGSPLNNIPARPWLVPGVEDKRPEIVEVLRKATLAGIDGDAVKVQARLNQAGLMAQSAAQAKIRNGPFAPLSARTLEARRARGVTRTKPLIDTGKLLASITYVIRRKP
jgi:hypothetical protein